MRGLTAGLTLVGARARRRRGRWLLIVLGIALATGFAGGVVAEATIAGDRGARLALAAVVPADRTVRVTRQGLVTASVGRRARALLGAFDLGAQTEVVLLNPVRLGGTVVRPAAIDPLGRWVAAVSPPSSFGRTRRGSCLPTTCPMLQAGGRAPSRALTALGVHVPIAGRTRLGSSVPLGFAPDSAGQEPPLLLTGDAAGLEGLAGLGGVYRAHSWLAPLRIGGLHAWQLAGLERSLQQAQAALLSGASQFSLSAPFAGLDAARAQADAAPRRLLLAGGGGLAALALFVVLAAGGLRRDLGAELERLENAGARLSQCVVFVVGEAALLCGFAVLLGAVLAVGAATLLAQAAGEPVGGVLAHSLITPVAAAVLICGWLCATALIAGVMLARATRLADLAAVAAAAGLTLALSRGSGAGDPLPVLLAPLCCLAAGVLVFRLASLALQAGERVARRGPVLARLALVGLARAPAAPSLAIAFIAVSTGLGGFALAYRATLLRATADQAADRVPLDAVLAPGPEFVRPLDLAPFGRWRSIAHGSVWPVRRTEASFVSGPATVTVPALGIPSSALSQLHGLRANEESAPAATLARRISPPGPPRAAGPELPVAARFLSLRVSAPGIAVSVTADLRQSTGAVRQVPLGTGAARGRTLLATIPRGSYELEAIELSEPTGLELTNGHQNGENIAAATRFTATVRLGSVRALGRLGRPLMSQDLGGWRAVGAASTLRPASATAIVRFAGTGSPGVLRPLQPTDVRPVPVLVDAQTAASAGRAGQLELGIDGVPVTASVVGVLKRFPTLPTDAAGFVIADERTLASALDAGAPGQGRADELWVSSASVSQLRAELGREPFSQLSYALRTDLEHRLREAPIARGVLGTLIAAGALAGALAVLGLLVSLLGSTRDPRVERDLVAQGVGPRELRRELRMRMLFAGALGVFLGLGVAAVLTRLAVASVRGSGTVAAPRPPLVAVAPWAELALWGVAAVCALGIATWAATRSLVGRRALA